MLPLIIQPIAIAISLSTATGVFIHDMYVDQATKVALTRGHVVKSKHELVEKSIKFTDPHTHSEHGSLSQATRDLKSQTPKTNPRTSDDKKRRNIKQKPRTLYTLGFDDYFDRRSPVATL